MTTGAFGRARTPPSGRAPRSPASQLATARGVAEAIGIPLREVSTDEGAVPEYVANEGESCLHCKDELYATLRAVALDAERKETAKRFASSRRCSNRRRSNRRTHVVRACVLYNGTNLDDRFDETRLGLVSAKAHGVRSPLFATPKTRVRELARVAGLPNWNLAAAPCLRSRLAFGVPALKTDARGRRGCGGRRARDPARAPRRKTCACAC